MCAFFKSHWLPLCAAAVPFASHHSRLFAFRMPPTVAMLSMPRVWAQRAERGLCLRLVKETAGANETHRALRKQLLLKITHGVHTIFSKNKYGRGGVIDAGWEALRWPVCCSSLVYYSRVTAQKYGEHYLCMILGSVNNVALPFRNVVIGLKLSGQPTWISSPLTRFPHLS